MHSGKLNWTQLRWTELDRSVQFGWVQFSCPLCIEPATSGDDRRRFLTVKNRRELSSLSLQLVAGFRPTTDIALIERFTTVCPDCEEPATTANIVAESSQVVAGSMHSGKLNWTEQLSWVEFSSASHCALGFIWRWILSWPWNVG